jgi:oxysterol-binding protein 1
LEEFEELKVETYNHQEDLRFTKYKNGNKNDFQVRDLNDPELIEELDDIFQSAHDDFVSTFLAGRQTKKKLEVTFEEEGKLETRDTLPFFKDPKVKISLWTIIKDSIGKDISKITVPVYFNAPMSLL